MTNTLDILSSLFECWQQDNTPRPMTVQDIGEIAKFMRYVNAIVSTTEHGNKNALEMYYTDILQSALDQINHSHPAFRISIYQPLSISSSINSVHIIAQLQVNIPASNASHANPIYIPLKYDYADWAKLDADIMKSDILRSIPASVIRLVINDTSSTLVNPTNFNSFHIYELDIRHFKYTDQEIVLYLSSKLSNLSVNLYYVWNAVSGEYQRLMENSPLGLKHTKNMRVVDKLKGNSVG